jgi:hypothetical protein
MSRRLLALAAVILLVLAMPAALGAKTKPFTPKLVAGTWSGNWSNQTFNTSGTITLQGKVTRKGRAFQFNVDLGGNALGCSDPAAEHTPTITKGSGHNHWNAKGFKLKLKSPAYGSFNVSYSQKTQRLTGIGENPSCAPGVAWMLDGKLTKSAFTGTVRITLPTGQIATSTINATRQ